MSPCHCTLPNLDKSACENCGYRDNEGFVFLPVNPEIHKIIIEDGRYVIVLRKE